MKLLFSIFFILQIGCIHKPIIPAYIFDGVIQNHEPGKCYYSILNTNKMDGQELRKVIIEVHPPIFKDSIISFSRTELISDKTFITIPLNDPYKLFVLIDIDELSYVEYPSGDTGYAYCVKDVPRRTKTVYLDTITDNSKIKFNKIIKPSHITYTVVNNTPKVIKPNQKYIEFISKTKEKEYVVGPICYSGLTSKIKKALIALGYELDNSPRLGEATKKALIDFQEKNNLQVGNLNYETLIKLGIIPHSNSTN